jgi:DNA polymerase III epsilon subunit-like protein
LHTRILHWPVTDYRTFVNGITKENLADVKFTFKHSQQFMMVLYSEETVIIGHAINNDLMTLKMEHHCVVDSAFLFKYKEQNAHMTTSLANLAIGVLGKEMPDTHDSVNDARTSLLVLEEYVKNDGKVDPVAWIKKKRPGGGREAKCSCEVFVHRIPRKCKEEHLAAMFLSHTYIQPKDVPIIDFRDQEGQHRGRCPVQFQSPQHASLAYETLETEEFIDRFNMPQKKVFLRDGDYICMKRPGLRKSKEHWKKKGGGGGNKRNETSVERRARQIRSDERKEKEILEEECKEKEKEEEEHRLSK